MSARTMILLLFIGTAFGQTSAPVTLTTNKPRPLMDLVRQLEAGYGWQITYEDPPYESPLDLVDVVSPNYLTSHPGATFVIPRPQALSVTLAGSAPSYSAAASDTNALGRIQSAIGATVAQANLNGAVAFSVSYTGDIAGVTPTQYRKKDGTTVPLQSILTATVSFPQAQRTIRDAVNLVCTQAAAARCIAISEGTIPTNFYHQVELTYANQEPASVVLSRIFSDNDAVRASFGIAPLRMAWDLLYDANAKSYYLNTHPTTQSRK